MYCIVLYCYVLYCVVMYCIVLAPLILGTLGLQGSYILRNKKTQGFPGLFFQGFSRALEAQNENKNVHNELFKTTCNN